MLSVSITAGRVELTGAMMVPLEFKIEPRAPLAFRPRAGARWSA